MPEPRREVRTPEHSPITAASIIRRAETIFMGIQFTQPNQEIQQGLISYSTRTNEDTISSNKENIFMATINGFPIAIMVDRQEAESLNMADSLKRQPMREVWIGGVHAGIFMHVGLRKYGPSAGESQGRTNLEVAYHVDNVEIDPSRVGDYYVGGDYMGSNRSSLDHFAEEYGVNIGELAREFGIS